MNDSSSAPVVVVSGGSRGLGFGIVEYLLSRGYRVATCSRSRSEGIDRLAAESGDNALLFSVVDLQDPNQLHEFVADVQRRFGRVDGLVNNAALAADGVLALTSDETIEQLLAVNVRGTLHLTRECVRRMLLTGAGSIVNISSVVAQRGFSGLSVYAATKGALEAMTRSLARELGGRMIRVNAIAPGYLETEMSQGMTEQQRGQVVRRTPLGRLGTVSDVLPAIEFFLSPASQFITGQVLVVDGGMSV